MSEMLFSDAGPPRRIVEVGPWERISAGLSGGKGAVWRHRPSGWVIEHCGHPTALWPWAIYDPEGRGPIVSHNGRGFRTLDAAKVELLTRVIEAQKARKA